MTNRLNLEELKDIISDCHVNFLIGSGVSRPYLPTLGNIENQLEELDKKAKCGDVTPDQEKLIKASIYKRFFYDVIAKNLDVLSEQTGTAETAKNYKAFIKQLNAILINRKSSLLNKQANIFTTNIDVFFEKAFEATQIEYSDGFTGRLNPKYSLSNFKKSLFKTSLHYDNVSEIPVFNLMKMHGSLTWEKIDNGEIGFSADLKVVQEIKKVEVTNGLLIEVNDGLEIDNLKEAAGETKPDETVANFNSSYEKLPIVNPTKEKFRETVLNRNYYELLRIYSNELEKENTVLLVMGFSFADEHIRDVTIRAANANPTLKIIVFSHSSSVDSGVELLKSESKNNNVQIVSPHLTEDEPPRDAFSYDLETINKNVFGELLKRTSSNEEDAEEE